jgi:hypothetical protein
MVMRTEEEIEALLSEELPNGSDEPTDFPGMTYEQGVEATALWILGYRSDKPLDG